MHKKVEYSCMPGHMLLGDPVLTCLRSGDWSISPPRCKYIDCDKVGALQGGKVHYLNDSTHLGSVVEFRCDRHYRLEGEERVTCGETGAWSAAPPSCAEIRCPAPDKINNTIFRPSSRQDEYFAENISYEQENLINLFCYRLFLTPLFHSSATCSPLTAGGGSPRPPHSVWGRS